MLNITVAYAFENNVDFLTEFQELARYFALVEFVAFYIGKDIETLYSILDKKKLRCYPDVKFRIPDEQSYKNEEVLIFYGYELVSRAETFNNIVEAIHRITDNNNICFALRKEIYEKIQTADKFKKEFLSYEQDILELYEDIVKILSRFQVKYFDISVKKLKEKAQAIKRTL